MHEFALIENILSRCLGIAQQNKAAALTDIYLEVGEFSLVIEHMFQQSFVMVRKDTIAETAQLHITRTPGVIYCNACAKESEIWWKNIVKDSDSSQRKSIQNYERTITPTNILTGQSDFGRNLFLCPHCSSNDTDLIKGKSIVIKNIKIKS